MEFENLDANTIASVGFLTLRGDEKLFALDGQHRLAGIKKAVKKNKVDSNPYDEISVIFVSHKNTEKGLERTRRLFTTLNKTARPVSKSDIIALDEDDVMAISVRWLIERTNLFVNDRIAFVASSNMPVTNTKSLTTIVTLYDTLSILFSNAETDLKDKRTNLQRTRPNDEELEKYFQLSKKYFETIGKEFKEVGEFFSSKNTNNVVEKYRGSHGGNVMFRPIGLEIFTNIIAQLTRDMPLSKAIQTASKLPRNLSTEPYLGLMWDSSTKTILNAHKVTLREVLMHMLGRSKFSEATLLERYRKETNNDTAELPKKVI